MAFARLQSSPEEHGDCVEDNRLDNNYGISKPAVAGKQHTWLVEIRLHTRWIRRLFPFRDYGSEEAACAQACAYRDEVLAVLPPVTNYERHTRLHPAHSADHVPGVGRFIKGLKGPYWGASICVNGKRRRKDFSVRKHGEETARALAVAQRQEWLGLLEVSFLTQNSYADTLARRNFPERLTPPFDAVISEKLADPAIDARLAAIDKHYDSSLPARLGIAIHRYPANKELTIRVSGSGWPRPLIKSTLGAKTRAREPRSLDELMTLMRNKIATAIETLYNRNVRIWFFAGPGRALAAGEAFDFDKDFELTVFVPEELVRTKT